MIRRLSGRLAVAAVMLLLGFLVVVQLRSQTADNGLSELSTQDLTALIANVTARNIALRDEIVALQAQKDSVNVSVQRGDTSTLQIRTDLSRVEGWSGELAITGPGVRIEIQGTLPGVGVEVLLNELRNAGAEGISVGGIRAVPGIVVTGPAGGLTANGVALGTPLEVLAVGQEEVLSGSLTRAGGPISQLAAQYPDVTITVVTADSVVLPVTVRNLRPSLGRPRI
jgi:uncharacterized protein YlxW (UPF0749 family)